MFDAGVVKFNNKKYKDALMDFQVILSMDGKY